ALRDTDPDEAAPADLEDMAAGRDLLVLVRPHFAVDPHAPTGDQAAGLAPGSPSQVVVEDEGDVAAVGLYRGHVVGGLVADEDPVEGGLRLPGRVGAMEEGDHLPRDQPL